MARRRTRKGHYISYRITWYVPGEDVHEARVACQYLLDQQPVPEGKPIPQFQQWTLCSVRERLEPAPECEACEGVGWIYTSQPYEERKCEKCRGLGVNLN